MRMRVLSLGVSLALATVVSGCKSNPYCLNCGQNGKPGAGDMAGAGHVDMQPDLVTPPDLTGGNGDGGCVPTNNGVEICDGLDNDCNGIVDDVAPSKLQNDPNNCGKCGTICDFTATHQLGACMNAMCSPSGCEPGWVDANHNPADGCELQCTPSNGGVEICDGVDNNCNGQIDEGFTATWQANGQPNYDSDINNCGACAIPCRLPGAVNKCVAGSGGTGVCQVDHCINNPGVDTFKHNPSNPLDINTVGCEYHCPVASSTAGDCNAATNTCTFPAEVCNGLDDDCDFFVDDHLTDPTLGNTCGANCPGGLVANCVGACSSGTISCVKGVLLCQGSTGPSPEICDGIDNNCNGLVDEPFTAPSPAGYAGGNPTKPLYNIDTKNCGSCNATCKLANAINGCRSDATLSDKRGECYVVSCNAGFNDPTPANPSPAPGVSCTLAPGVINGSPANVSSGVGCWYGCAKNTQPNQAEVCNGIDDDCNACIDDNLTPPPNFCSKQGVCAGTGAGQSPASVFCAGTSGWKCDYYTTLYAKGAPVDLTVNSPLGNLKTSEIECDGLDNNCNGYCDENFPFTATPNNTALCAQNPGRVAKSCTGGQGACQLTGTFCCGTTAGACLASSTAEVCSASANGDPSKATNEVCNGKDDNCNGLIDDPNNNTIGGVTYLGYHDPVVSLSVPADSSLFGIPTAHTVYMYPYEASRPDSTGTSPGAISTRSCAKAGVIPWGDATELQAASACAAAGGRLCTAVEWQTACEGPAPVAPTGSNWSIAKTSTGASLPYTSGVCNDFNAGKGAPWATGSAGSVSGDICSTVWPGASPSPIADLSGNLFEWTRTPVTTTTPAATGSAATLAAGSTGQMAITGLANLPATNGGVGGFIQLSGSATHDGVYMIASNGTTSANVFASNGGTDANSGAIQWTYGVPLDRGTTASLASGGSGLLSITGLSGLTAAGAAPGMLIQLGGSASHDGSYAIVSFTDTSAVVSATNGGSDGNNGAIDWALLNTYYQLRGGSYSSPSGGTTCEFNFDIANPGFTNGDVGFRCCFDAKP